MSKLVRDLIPNVIPVDKLCLYKFSIVDKEQYAFLLRNKLQEEVESEDKEELADILEVSV